MCPKTPKVLAYHPEIAVDHDGQHHLLKLSVGDYADDREILKDLAKQVKTEDKVTVGDIVDAVKAHKLCNCEVVSGVAKESVGDGKKVWSGDEVV